MRIAVLCHAHHTPPELESEYLVGYLAARWRRDGHDVRFHFGFRDWSGADIAILHVDLSVVPARYLAFGRRFPVVLNLRVRDIRKSTISRNLVDPESGYTGPVFMKTDLNSAGIPEHKLQARGAWQRLRRRFSLRAAAGPLDYDKRYAVFPSLREVPAGAPGSGWILERFRPEQDAGLYFTRRTFVLGDRFITMRMGYTDPTGAGVPAAVEWTECPSEIHDERARLGLDYGVIDYTMAGGEVVLLDINKTIGTGPMHIPEERENYFRMIEHLAPGIEAYRDPVRGSSGRAG